MEPSTAFQLARGAWAFQRKLARLPYDVAPQRLRAPGAPWAGIAGVKDPLARQRVLARLFTRLVGPWPPLERLGDRTARLALADGITLLRHFCLLALAARPGILRRCIEQRTRVPLKRVLGPAFQVLEASDQYGMPLDPDIASWTPMHWACVGHLEWTRLLQPADAGLRRMARLSLPPGLMNVHAALHGAPARLSPDRALASIDELGLEWSC